MTIDLKTLDELERLSSEATSAPWEGNGRGAYVAMMHINDNRIEKYISAPQAEMCMSNRDIDFIVQSRNALPDLIQAVRKMRDALTRVQSMAGNPDATAGCRVIISHARACLKELGLE